MVSIGYKNEHSTKESLDFGFLTGLRDTVLASDFTKLPVDRKVTDCDDYWHDETSFDIDIGASYGTQDILVETIKKYPAETADLLEEFGLTHHDICERLAIKRYSI